MIMLTKSMDKAGRNRQFIYYVLKNALFIGVYFFTARIGLKIDPVSGFATLVWPPTGIALAVMLLYGYRFWPGVALGAFFVNIMIGAPFLVAWGIATGNTLEAIVGAYLLQRADFHKSMDRLKDVFTFVVLAAGLSTTISATIGVASLWLGHAAVEGLGETWRAWWAGDALGALIVAPPLLAWTGLGVKSKVDFWRITEALLLMFSVLAVGSFIFGQPSGLVFWFFPFVGWGALRFGQTGNVTVTLIVCVMAIIGTAQGLGPFSQASFRDNLFLLHSFLAIVSITGMSYAAAFAERNQALITKSEEELHRSAILMTSMDCIVSMDHEGKIRGFNPAAETTFGYKHSEALGKNMAELIIPPRYREAHQAGLKHYLNNGEGKILDQRLELFGMRRDGSEFPIELSITRMGMQGPPMFTGFIRDISERIRHRADEEVAKERLRKALVFRDEFLSIASHELKTPLSSLFLQLQITKRAIQPETKKVPSPEELEKSMAMSLRQVKSLTSLVAELLDVSRIQTGRFTLNKEAVDLVEIVRDIVGRFSEQLVHSKCPIELNLADSIVGHWDRNRIEQIVVNLISNTIKYAPGSRVNVQLTTNNGWASLVVQDFGPGIPPERQDKLFERFERAASSRNISGLGLGLFVVKRIAEAHDGCVHLESALGKGAKFIIDLPLESALNEAPSEVNWES